MIPACDPSRRRLDLPQRPKVVESIRDANVSRHGATGRPGGNVVGSWGPGIFDNDAARDHLFEVTRELAEQIEQALADAIALKLTGRDTEDDVAITIETVLPNVEIMCVLHESLGGGFLPEPESAAEWQSQFEQLEAACSAERHEIVRVTFERLRRLSQQCWGE